MYLPCINNKDDDDDDDDLRRLRAHTKTVEKLIRELLFADDDALVTHTGMALQGITTCFAEVVDLFGLEVSLRRQKFFTSPLPLRFTFHPVSSLSRPSSSAT